MKEHLNVYDFGAVGDGTADDTAAIQSAIDQAAETGTTVYIPQGIFACAGLKLKPFVGLYGEPTWSFRKNGGSILRLNSDKVDCLLDITMAYGATIHGLCLDGRGLGSGIHGIMVNKPDYGKTEDTPRIERCRIDSFTGDGVHLGRIWCFSIRHCMVSHNQGSGLWVQGWDGFILDNWFTGNRGPGYFGEKENASITMNGNRVEWNSGGGIVIYGGNHYNITGNYIDRSGGPGICLLSREGRQNQTISITGNVIYRSGAPRGQKMDEYGSSQLRFEGVKGLVCSGNAMNVGRDDGQKGDWSPNYGIVYGALESAVIKDNVMHHGALKQLVLDLGNHTGEVIVKDNPGSLFNPS